MYSLGVTLFESVTGVRPFRGDLPEILSAVRFGPPSLEILLGRPVDRGLVAILDRALDERPSARFASPGALADDLERWLRGERPRAVRGLHLRRTARVVIIAAYPKEPTHSRPILAKTPKHFAPPILRNTATGFELSQTPAILEYLGEKFGLVPHSLEDKAARPGRPLGLRLPRRRPRALPSRQAHGVLRHPKR